MPPGKGQEQKQKRQQVKPTHPEKQFFNKLGFSADSAPFAPTPPGIMVLRFYSTIIPLCPSISIPFPFPSHYPKSQVKQFTPYLFWLFVRKRGGKFLLPSPSCHLVITPPKKKEGKKRNPKPTGIACPGSKYALLQKSLIYALFNVAKVNVI